MPVDADDLFAPEVIADPNRYFGELRATDPVHWNARHALFSQPTGVDAKGAARKGFAKR